MKAFIFTSSVVENLHYVVLEDGSFAGAFNETVPKDVTATHEAVYVKLEDAGLHKGLLAALALNKKLSAVQPTIYVFGLGEGDDLRMHFALAESGYVLAALTGKTDKRARWELGINGPCPATIKYEDHYPDGFHLEWVPSEDLDNNPGLGHARTKNQMLAELLRSANDGKMN
ncbi:MAG: hypothetical protein DRQ48_00205 [Gammaproteobacteria bacterium]|nr:MAG: hypothetical protein DRQ48_00205 [Gammaproteobacteria bacterium]